MRDKLYTVLFMVVVSAAFTGLVSGVNLLCKDRIDVNRELAENRARLQAAGIEGWDGDPATVDTLHKTWLRPMGADMQRPKAWEYRDGRLGAGAPVLGYVIAIGGQGFWDLVEGYLLLSPGKDAIRGIAFSRQNETPGLGAEITSQEFMGRFGDVPLRAQPDEQGRYVRIVRAGDPKEEYDVDGVTGATGTSKAVERFLNADLAAFLSTSTGGDG